MNKKNLLFVFMFLSFQFLFSQTAIDSVTINKIKGFITNDGSVFTNKFQSGGFETPIGSGKTTIYSSGIWLGAMDIGGQLYVAGVLYHQIGYDFRCGPSSTADSTQAAFYDKIYRITKDEVNNHILHYKDGGYVIPNNILNWPCNGRSTYNEPKKLALFNDKNSNNIYEPNLGEVPIFPGDEAALCIYNDNRTHTETGGVSLNADIYQMVYAYKNTTDSILANTVFVSYRIVNRSQNNYKNLYIGQYVDFDLGYYGDDYVGCDTTLNLMYGYNGIDYDSGILGYGKNPPAMGCVFLNKTMGNCMYYNNDNSINGNPTQADHFYNYLQSKWKDGTLLTSDKCNGYGGNVPAHYMFPGDPYYKTGWTEESCGNTPADRRLLGSTGSLTFDTAAEICYNVAYIFARADSALTSVKLLKDRTKILLNMYNNKTIDDGCTVKVLTGISSENIAEKLFEIFPNPTAENFIVKYNGEKISDMMIYDITGKIIYRNTIKPNSETVVNSENFASGIYLLSVGHKNIKLVKE